VNSSESPIRVLLVDAQDLFREGLAQILTAERDLQVVGKAKSAKEAIALAEARKPDAVVLDIEVAGTGPREILQNLLRASPASKFIVLTQNDEPHLVEDFVTLGVRAYVLKSATKGELIATMLAVDEDEDRVVLSVSRETLKRLVTRRDDPVLSARELEVLSWVARGLSNAHIASRLFISEGTVRRHLTNTYAKLGVTSRVQAVNKAVSARMITVKEALVPDERIHEH
jgi:DNA-binding NarL/FixJ family response regulator